MKKLTKREKKLLTVLFTGLVLVLGIMYWVLPTMSDLDMLKIEKNELSNQKLDMEVKIAQTNKLLENKEELIDEAKNLMNQMSDPLLGENFDLQVQSKAKLHNVKIGSVHYGPTQVLTPSANGTTPQQYEYNLKTLVHLVYGSSDEVAEVNETEHEVLKKTATLTVNGSYLNIQKLLHELNNMGQTYFVNSITYSRSDTEIVDDESGLVVDTSSNETATIQVDVYFIKMDNSASGNLSEKG